MAVKASQSGARILHALELIAQHQPVGVSDLARLLETNVAAAQRAIATLAEEGWIRPVSGRQRGWELTAHIHTVAQHAHGSHDLRQRARDALEQLWQEAGESVLLIVLDGDRFIVVDVLESPHYVRSAPPVGLVVPPRASATAWAILPFMSAERQAALLDGPPDCELLAKCAETIQRGYAVSHGDVFAGSTNIAAPIFELGGDPVGAVLVSVPNDRAGTEVEARLGALVMGVARQLSRGSPPEQPSIA
ncbi:MAG: IclR family transcriptional regulator [Novosphingobium sp.]|nr:IclR family transcriptional regulator [Novosphingobium sp.]MCP5403143.1 IclR family transcriptional regulator [Novosphingobium sp.]